MATGETAQTDKAKPLSILLIEDNPGDRRLVQEMLDECAGVPCTLHHAEQIGAAIPVLEREAIDIIILDLGLPDGSGLDTLVKTHALAPGTPIVVLSELENEALAVKAVRMGAQDFLLKSHISGPLLTRSLRYAMERRQLEEHLHRLAYHDPLTDLPNRKLFYERFARALAAGRRHRRPIALMLADLNGFKQINDSFGHHVGDELLRQMASRVVSCLRATDCVARLGGDEFIIYVSDLSDVQYAARVAQKIIDVCEVPYAIEGRSLIVPCSLGVAIYPDDGESMETLVRNADSAMYLAKGQGGGGNRFRFYQRELDQAALQRRELETELRAALANDDFILKYQPQFDLRRRRLAGVEALIRWQRNGEEVLPSQFMAALEESGLITEVGKWVLSTACGQAMRWKADGYPVKVAVNLSFAQFCDPQLTNLVADALRKSSLDAHLLELEISEDCLRDDESLATDILRQLNALGVRLALDNYRGRSLSLRDLKRFPIHSVKLDRSLIRDMTESPDDAAIARAVISVAHVFNMKGVAEGVESAGQLALLREHACDDAQGFMFAKPLAAEALSDALHAGFDTTRLQ
ncbi:MAG: EAL domain-containing protein [Rhodocyclaceae bacterium]|nr:EAL domain-containing protein [Rhodocyclaceae bacterium]